MWFSRSSMRSMTEPRHQIHGYTMPSCAIQWSISTSTATGLPPWTSRIRVPRSGRYWWGGVKSDGLPVKPHDWGDLACRSWMQAVNDLERWPRAPGLDREVRRARLVANRLHRAVGVNPQAAGAKSVKLVRDRGGAIAGQQPQGQGLKRAGVDVGRVARLGRQVERVGQEAVVRMVLRVGLQDAGGRDALGQGAPGAARIEPGKLDQAVGVNQTAPLH